MLLAENDAMSQPEALTASGPNVATSNVIKGQGFANDLEAARKRTVNGKARDPDGSQPFPLVALIPLESRVRLRVFDLHSLRKLVCTVSWVRSPHPLLQWWWTALWF